MPDKSIIQRKENSFQQKNLNLKIVTVRRNVLYVRSNIRKIT